MISALFGCGRKSGTAFSKADHEAFAKAPPEIKQVWDRATEAGQTNDYVTAETLLYGLYGSDLTAEQRGALSHVLGVMNKRLSEAAKNGDPIAKQALEEFRRSPPNRPRR